MGIKSVTIDPTSWTGSEDDKGIRTYSVTYFVETDTINDGPFRILDHPSIPPMQSRYQLFYDNDPDAYVVSRNVRQHSQSPFRWEVTVQWKQVVQDPDGDIDNPDRLRRSLRSTKFTRVLEKDQEGKEIKNSAGQPFDPLPEIEEDRPILVFTRRVKKFNLALAANYMGAVNSDSFLGQEPRTWKIVSWSSDEQIEDGQRWFDETIEMEYSQFTWDLELLDAGRYELDSKGDLKPIKDADGNLVADMVPLNGQGKKKKPNEPPVFLKFRRYKELAFGPLGLRV